MANQVVFHNDRQNDSVTLNTFRKSRKRKRTASEVKLWVDVFNNIVSDLQSNSTNSPSNSSHNSSIPSSSTNSRSETSFIFKNYDIEKAKNNPKIIKYNEEITGIVNSVSVLDVEVNQTVTKIMNDLETVVKNQVPKHSWHYFGSYLNGLGCKDSDIDLYFESQEYASYSIPNKIEKLIRKNPRLFSNILFLKRARIPLIKMVHVDTRKELDISFSSEMGVRNSKLTKLYLTFNSNVKILTVYLKHALKKYDLQGTCKITTYILFWLVVFFMQQKNLLPPVIDIRKAVHEKYYVLGWDCSVPEKFPCSTKEQGCLYLLLREFLKFYRDFDFLNNVICPYLARYIPLSDFENLQIPSDAFSVYIRRMRDGQVNSFSRHVMNLQDPSDHSFNLAKQVDIAIANKFKIFCYYVYRILPDGISKTSKTNAPLSKIFPVRLPNENYQPKNLTQFISTYLDVSTLPENSLSNFRQNGIAFVLGAFRRMMENVFALEAASVITRNITRTMIDKEKTTKMKTSVAYLEYRTTANTWKNGNISRIFSLDATQQKTDAYEPFSVCVICEVCVQKETVRTLVQSEVHLSNFLNKNINKLLLLMLEQNRPITV